MSAPRDLFNNTAGDFRVPDNPLPVNRLAAQNLQHATTTPRKRVVLDYDPSTKEISTKFSLRNSSDYAVAFKVQSTFEIGYVSRPCNGIVQAGEDLSVKIVLNDLQSLGRDVERDKFMIELASVDSELAVADNVSYDEKRILSIGISQAAKDRLVFEAGEQKRKLMMNTVRIRQQRMMKYVGAGVLAILGVVFICVDFCALSASTAWEVRKV